MRVNISILACSFITATASSNTTAILFPPDLIYLLPTDFSGNVSQNFLQMLSSDLNTSEIFSSAASNPFTAYSQEFLNLLAPNATLELIATSSVPLADEMGIWVWDHNQVWMASPTINGTSYVSILDLSTNKVSKLESTIEVLTPVGTYHNSLVCIVGHGNATIPPSIYSINPSTFETKVIVNSCFGLRFNVPNDITWATTTSGKNTCSSLMIR